MTADIKTTDDTAAPARPHLDMKPEDMFPETTDPAEQASLKATLANPFFVDAPDDGPRPKWLMRLTRELQPAEVLRLFQPPAHLITRRALAVIDEIYGEMAVKLLEAGIPNVEGSYRHPARGRLRRLAERFADRFLDMVPRGEMEFHRNQFLLQQQARAARAALQGAQDMVGTLRDKIVEIEARIFPGLKAAVREGESFRGERTVAVWGGVDEAGRPTEPTHDPDF